ncbi:prephenate dehydratase [Micromonospora sp. ATCC 39149]|nr:prephenate dehydratase [Micromonospora sp. ATCC 39149]
MPGTPPTRFVYLGPEGTFAEQALRTVPAAERGTRTPARSVGEALESVRAGEADAALVPLENSIGGAVGVTLDELAEGEPLVITREVILPVEFVLGARPGTSPEAIRSVAAHPQASTQCRGWLRAHLPDAVVVDVLSNGAAAAGAATGEYDAAICAPIGAARHRLAVLADKIADHPDAVTRFVMLSRPGPPSPPTGDDVTSLAVYIAHDRVGALLSVLMELGRTRVNLDLGIRVPLVRRRRWARYVLLSSTATDNDGQNQRSGGVCRAARVLRGSSLPRLVPPAKKGAAGRRPTGARAGRPVGRRLRRRGGLAKTEKRSGELRWAGRPRVGAPSPGQPAGRWRRVSSAGCRAGRPAAPGRRCP